MQEKANTPTTKQSDAETFVLPQWSVSFGEAAPPRVQRSPASDAYSTAPVAYTLQRCIGAGGWGEVWESVQQSLGRLIAVKRVRPDLYDEVRDDELRLRQLEEAFRQEALTTASLDHPNILPVHDLGMDEDGRPLLAMKLVRGKPWGEQLREEFHAVPVPDFLARHLPILAGVGQAVAFAHSRGIVHRDIKASQVMVGEFGEVLLMDWGLAVVYDRSLLDSTVPQARRELAPPLERAISPAGTWGYMAPEQAARTAAGVGPWTDVYLLGGTLYHLLCGSPPHHGDDSRQLQQQVELGIVTPVESQMPGREKPPELVNLAMEALAPNPANRVPSAREFVRRLQDYLSGATRRRESLAMADSISARIEALGQHYAEYSDLAVMLTNAHALWPENPVLPVLNQRVVEGHARAALDNGDLVLARFRIEQLSDGRTREELARRLAQLEDAEREAGRRLELAHRHLSEQHERAQELLNFMLGDLRDRLQAIGRLDVLTAVADKALAYFSSSTAVDVSDPGRARRTKALHEIGEVRMAQGDLDGAMQAFRDALDLSRELHSLDPRNTLWQFDFAESNARVGKVLRARGDLDGALAFYSLRMSILEGLLAFDPGNVDALHSLAQAHDDFADAHAVRGDLGLAATHNRRFREILSTLLARERRPDWLRSMRTAIANHGWILKAQGDLDAALAQYAQALGLARRLVEEEPGSAREQDDLAFLHNKLAGVREARGEFAEAVREYETALDILRGLVSRDPSNAAWQRLLAVTHVRGGSLEQAQGDWDLAVANFTEAVETLHRLTLREPENVWNINWLAQAYVGRGRALAGLGREDQARRDWEQAVELAAPVASPPDRAELRHLFTHAHALHLLGRGELAGPLVTLLRERGFRDAEFLRVFPGGAP